MSRPLSEAEAGLKPGEGRGPLAWMARNPVAANLLMLILMIGGFTVLPRIRQEVLPSFELDMIQVSIGYPGASPEEVEQGILLSVEETVRGVDGVKQVGSLALEGQASINAELLLSADPQRVLADIKTAVDRITSMPEQTERPVFGIVNSKRKVISLVVSGPTDEQALRTLAERARERLLQSRQISQVELRGAGEREISIDVPQAELRRFNVTLSQVASAVRLGSVDLPAGAVRTAAGELLLRTTERRETAADFESIAVLTQPDGTEVTVGDVARVREGFREEGMRATLNGGRAIMLDVFRIGSQTPVDVSDAVHAQAEKLTAEAPPGLQYRTWDDASEAFRGRRDLMLENAAMGFVLVLLVLGMFLDLRLAFWVTAGIPISFIGSMLVFPSFDVSVNMVSMFAFIVALGMVVDDAIVAGESIYKCRQDGMPPVRAAIVGIRKVAAPVTFSVLSTVIAFAPLLFVPGAGGKFMRNVPLIVIAVLAISLVESLFILPAHLAHARDGEGEGGVFGWIARHQKRMTAGLDRFVRGVYRPALQWCLERRALTLATGIAMLIASAGLIAGGRVAFSFLPKIDSDMISVGVKLPFGTARAETEAAVRRIERAAQVTLDQAGGAAVLSKGVFAEVGDAGDHSAMLSIQLTPSDQREISASELATRMRARVGDMPGVESLRFEYTAKAGPPGRPIDLELSHADMGVLHEAAKRLALAMQGYQGIVDVDSGAALGKEQLDFALTPLGRVSGIDATSLGTQLRSAFLGQEVLRQQRGRDEVRVTVRRPASERRSEADIERTLLRTSSGADLPLYAAATVTRRRSFTQIERRDGRRLVHVSADVAEGSSSGELVRTLETEVLPGLLEDVPGLSYEIGGAGRSQNEANGALGAGFTMAMFGIFALLAIPFRSYWQPLVVLSAIPFGFVGAVLGHWLMGFDLSLMSMMGLVALSGVVVNDSLVLVVAINERREEGASLTEALLSAGVRRFRPILLTSLTTFFGLAPMLMETSVQARFMVPMAISLAFGIMFATFITLLLVPVFYALLHDFVATSNSALGWLVNGPQLTPSPALAPAQAPAPATLYVVKPAADPLDGAGATLPAAETSLPERAGGGSSAR